MIYKSYFIEENIDRLNNNIVLFYGENLGLKNDLRKIIKNISKAAFVKNLDQDEVLANENKFYNDLLNKSLFGEEKIFFINQTNDKILDLVKEVETKVDSAKIYLFSELLDRKSKLRSYFEKSNTLGIVPCYADNEISLKKIISGKLKGYTGLSSHNLNMIIENCGLDRYKLNDELEKIAIFFENKIIDTSKLEILLNLKVNNSFDLLKDQALIGDRIKTNKLISDTILENEKNIFYLNVINQRLIKLLEVNKNAKDSNLDDAINKIKPPIFWKDKAIFSIQARKWKSSKLKKLLGQTYKIELKVKSNSQIKQSILIKKLLVDMCCLANA